MNLKLTTKLDRMFRRSSHEESIVLWSVLRSAIGRHVIRSRFVDARAHRDLQDWEFLWDALAWSDELLTRLSRGEWIQEQGPCWLLCDRAKNQAWVMDPQGDNEALPLDTYVIGTDSRTHCFVSPHEEHLGPWIIEFSEHEVNHLKAL